MCVDAGPRGHDHTRRSRNHARRGLRLRCPRGAPVPPRGRPHHHLHIRHNRSAQGCRAHPRQPPRRGKRQPTAVMAMRRDRQRRVLPTDAHVANRWGAALQQHRHRHADRHARRPETGDHRAPRGAADVLRRGSAGLVQGEGRDRAGPGRGAKARSRSGSQYGRSTPDGG